MVPRSRTLASLAACAALAALGIAGFAAAASVDRERPAFPDPTAAPILPQAGDRS